MKTFNVIQQYASLKQCHSGKKLDTPILLGRYQASTIVDAMKAASTQHNIPGLLITAKLVVFCQSPDTCNEEATRVCLECRKHLCYGHTLIDNGLDYCSDHVPSYDRHQQW